MISNRDKKIAAVGLLILLLIGLIFVSIGPFGSVGISDKPSIDVDGYLAENIVRDSSTGRYWWVFSDRNFNGVRMASSPDLIHWEVENNLLIKDSPLDSVCVRRFGGIWYLYYAKHFGDTKRRANIWMCSSSSIDEGYSDPQLILDVNELNEWDSFRVSEPDIMWKDGLYYLFYMGESKDKYEKIGYAISNSPSGPFVKYINNPVLYGSELKDWKWNSGHDRAADPFIFQIDEGYIIQHTACRVSKREWSIGWAFTKDFVTFKTLNDPVLTSGSWAKEAVSRGCILEINDKYYMTFAGFDGGVMKSGKCGLVEIKNFEELKNKLVL